MKTKRILIALSLAIFASFNLIASVPQNVKVEPDTIKHRINIRVAQNNQVMLRAACCEGQKWVNLVLKVYSNDGEMVYAQSMHKKGGIYKAFDMQKLPEGKYSFEKQRELKVLIIEDEPFAQQELKRLLALDPKQFFQVKPDIFCQYKINNEST